MKKILTLFFASTFLFQSCGNKTEKKATEIPQTTKIPEKESVNKTALKPKIFTDTFEFDYYNDNGDYMWLYAKNGKEIYGFINDKNDDRSLLRGDICQIEWKKDTIYIAGDGDTPEIEDWLVSIKKIEGGSVSKFRKEYTKKLKYHWDEENYTQNYLDEIYLLTEYYIANSKSELIKHAIKDKDQIEYSIEKRTENNRDYDVLGIGYMFEHRFTIMQWIYIDRETKNIYEYDLPNEKLIAFE